VIIFSSEKYNDVPYFFRDESGKASFSLEETRVFGKGIKKWANQGLYRFMPIINHDYSCTSSLIQNSSYIETDSHFENQAADNWYVLGTQTSQLESDQCIISYVDVDDGMGNCIRALKLQKKKDQLNALVSLLVPKPRSPFSAHANLRIKSDSFIKNNIFLQLSLVNSYKTEGDYGRPIISKSTKPSAITINSLNTIPTDVLLGSGVLVHNPDAIQYSHILLTVNLCQIPCGDPIYITDIHFNCPF